MVIRNNQNKLGNQALKSELKSTGNTTIITFFHASNNYLIIKTFYERTLQRTHVAFADVSQAGY